VPVVREIVANLDDNGYRTLREEIVSGRLLPNERLVELELSDRLGIGRAAVRTALVRLEAEGLITRERHRGAKVRLVEEHEAIEIVEARAVLEGLGVRHAAANATPEDIEGLSAILAEMRRRLDAGDLLGASDQNGVLHRRLLAIGGHGIVEHLISMLNSQVVRFQYRTILVPGRPELSYAEHAAIVQAVADRDPAAAEAAMRRHLSNVGAALTLRPEGGPRSDG
jgi:DNA-binding GntR family transcriptional regulator